MLFTVRYCFEVGKIYMYVTLDFAAKFSNSAAARNVVDVQFNCKYVDRQRGLDIKDRKERNRKTGREFLPLGVHCRSVVCLNPFPLSRRRCR